MLVYHKMRRNMMIVTVIGTFRLFEFLTGNSIQISTCKTYPRDIDTYKILVLNEGDRNVFLLVS